MRIDEKNTSCTISQVYNPRYHSKMGDDDNDDTHVFLFLSFFCFLAMNGNEIIIDF